MLRLSPERHSSLRTMTGRLQPRKRTTNQPSTSLQSTCVGPSWTYAVDGPAVERHLQPAVGPADRPERALDPGDVRLDTAALLRTTSGGQSLAHEPLQWILKSFSAVPVVERLLLRRREDRPELVVDVADRRARSSLRGRMPSASAAIAAARSASVFMAVQSARAADSLPVFAAR